MDTDAFDFRSASPRARPLKVVAAALDPEHDPEADREGQGYPVLLKASAGRRPARSRSS